MFRDKEDDKTTIIQNSFYSAISKFKHYHSYLLFFLLVEFLYLNCLGHQAVFPVNSRKKNLLPFAAASSPNTEGNISNLFFILHLHKNSSSTGMLTEDIIQCNHT